MFLKTRFTVAPLLILDLRDGFAQTFAGPGVVVRVTEGVTVLAEPAPAAVQPRGPVELVTVATSAGLLGFFGRVRIPNGPLRRGLLPVGQYRLTVQAPGFQTAAVPATVSEPDGTAAPLVVVLQPAGDYPFPTGRRPSGNRGLTLLRGAVLQTDGTGQADVAVSIDGQPAVKPCATDASGQWVLVLDPPGDLSQKPPAGPVTLVLRFPGGQVLRLAGVAVVQGE